MLVYICCLRDANKWKAYPLFWRCLFVFSHLALMSCKMLAKILAQNISHKRNQKIIVDIETTFLIVVHNCFQNPTRNPLKVANSPEWKVWTILGKQELISTHTYLTTSKKRNLLSIVSKNIFFVPEFLSQLQFFLFPFLCPVTIVSYNFCRVTNAFR